MHIWVHASCPRERSATETSPPPPTGLAITGNDAKLCLGPVGAQCCLQLSTGVAGQLNSNCPITYPNFPPSPPADPPPPPDAPAAPEFLFSVGATVDPTYSAQVQTSPGTYRRVSSQAWGALAYDTAVEISGLDSAIKGVSFRCPYFYQTSNPDSSTYSGWVDYSNGMVVVGLRPVSTAFGTNGVLISTAEPSKFAMKVSVHTSTGRRDIPVYGPGGYGNTYFNCPTTSSAASGACASVDWSQSTFEIRITSEGIKFAKDGVVFHTDTSAIQFPLHAYVGSYRSGNTLVDMKYLTATDSAGW